MAGVYRSEYIIVVSLYSWIRGLYLWPVAADGVGVFVAVAGNGRIRQSLLIGARNKRDVGYFVDCFSL